MTASADDSILQHAPGYVSPTAGRRFGELHVPTVDLSAVKISAEVCERVPRSLAEALGVMPFACDGHTLQVAGSDPLDVEGMDSLRHQVGLDLEFWLAEPHVIARAIEQNYGDEFGADELKLLTGEAPELAGVPESVEETEDDGPVVKWVHDLILEAVRRRASDIHLEPLEKRFRVRCRIDGVLQEVAGPPRQLQRAIVSRIKIMADISIAEKRLPQDGRMQITLAGRMLDLRVSSLPTTHGESVVMRILDRLELRPGLEELGLATDDRTRLEPLITSANGLILVTGPTGSGKTTTLYSCLQLLNAPDRKIITVEDPVEYQLNGINQVSVHPESGMTFARALRAMLRQSPNTVMVGEIRDRETADTALHASLTGHLILSTLHTNDAIGALTRLTDLGVPPFLLSGALRAVLAQRLVRKICQECRRADTPTAAALALLDLDGDAASGATFMRGVGCPTCAGTGFHGRIGIFELLVLDDEISQLIHEPPGSVSLRAHARARGMRTLREDGARKVIAGLTTIGEVVSITTADAR